MSKREETLVIALGITMLIAVLTAALNEIPTKTSTSSTPSKTASTSKLVWHDIQPKETKLTCKFSADVGYNEQWIRACYLRELITDACKQIFDINGKPRYQVTFDNYNQWMQDSLTCSCRLPINIAQQINADHDSAYSQCDILPQ